jgi:hypothetical protein
VRRIRTRTLLLVVIGLATSACVTTNAVRLGNAAARPKIGLDQVAVYLSASQVPGKYEEVALLNSTGNTAYTNEAKMLKNMRFTAGEMGANAIILDAVVEPGAATKIAGALLGTGAERKGKAVAIYVFADSLKKSR